MLRVCWVPAVTAMALLGIADISKHSAPRPSMEWVTSNTSLLVCPISEWYCSVGFESVTALSDLSLFCSVGFESVTALSDLSLLLLCPIWVLLLCPIWAYYCSVRFESVTVLSDLSLLLLCPIWNCYCSVRFEIVTALSDLRLSLLCPIWDCYCCVRFEIVTALSDLRLLLLCPIWECYCCVRFEPWFPSFHASTEALLRQSASVHNWAMRSSWSWEHSHDPREVGGT
jgi:hypothetical protein